MTTPTHDRDDAMLRALFRDAHANDPSPPSFASLTQDRSVRTRSHWQRAMACCLLLAGVLAFLLARPTPESNVLPLAPGGDTTHMAALEDFAIEAHAWEAPTDFLLDDPLGDYSLVTQPLAFESSLSGFDTPFPTSQRQESNP